MIETILQTFLNKQFIKTSDVGNIENLTRAANAVKAYLVKKKQQVIPYTLVALDPQIPDNDPVVLEVEAIIIKNWATFKNSTSTKDKPTTYVRVVILQALSELAKSDGQFGAIIWLTGRNVIPYYQTQKEREPILELLVGMGNVFEIDSRKIWSVTEPKMAEIKQLSISVPARSSAKLDQTELTAELKAAAGHNGWVSQTGGGENPYYPAQGDWNWAKFFSERAATGLATVIDKSLADQSKSISSLTDSVQSDVNEYFAQFKEFLANSSKSLNQSATAANKRGELLWWKQTLYSPSLNDSYRNQDPILVAISMALDLSDLLGSFYPESANYLLSEALRDVYPDLDKKETFTIWVELALNLSGSGKLILASLESSETERKSLASALANILNTGNHNLLLQQTGIEPDQEISLSKLAVWLLHDLQAAKISRLK